MIFVHKPESEFDCTQHQLYKQNFGYAIFKATAQGYLISRTSASYIHNQRSGLTKFKSNDHLFQITCNRNDRHKHMVVIVSL